MLQCRIPLKIENIGRIRAVSQQYCDSLIIFKNRSYFGTQLRYFLTSGEEITIPDGLFHHFFHNTLTGAKIHTIKKEDFLKKKLTHTLWETVNKQISFSTIVIVDPSINSA